MKYKSPQINFRYEAKFLEQIRLEAKCTEDSKPCDGKRKTLDQMSNYQITYDTDENVLKLNWMDNRIRPDILHRAPKLSSNSFREIPREYEDAIDTNSSFVELEDYSSDLEAEQEAELTLEDQVLLEETESISFGEEISNILQQLTGSCEDDAVVVFLYNNHSSHNNSVVTLALMRFPASKLEINDERENIWTWDRSKKPNLQDNHIWHTGINYWTYHYGYAINRNDAMALFFSYIIGRTYDDWDPDMINSKNINLRHPKRPFFARRLFQLKNNRAESTLELIINDYYAYLYDRMWNANWNTYQSYGTFHHWITLNNLPYKRDVQQRKEYNFNLRGTEYQWIIAPLREATVIKQLTVCLCNDDPGNPIAATANFNTRSFNTIWALGRFKTIAQFNGLFPVDASNNNCGNCRATKKYVQYFVGDSTWLLYFEPKPGSIIQLNQNDFENIPLEIKIRDSFRQKQLATFDLGYISFITPQAPKMDTDMHGPFKYVSMMYLWGEWYYYDPMVGGGIITLMDAKPHVLVEQYNLVFNAIVFFRR